MFLRMNIYVLVYVEHMLQVFFLNIYIYKIRCRDFFLFRMISRNTIRSKVINFQNFNY